MEIEFPDPQTVAAEENNRARDRLLLMFAAYLVLDGVFLHDITSFLRLVLTSIWMVLVFRGHAWARKYLAFSFSLCGAATISITLFFLLLGRADPVSSVFVLAIGALVLTLGSFMTTSVPLKRYLSRRRYRIDTKQTQVEAITKRLAIERTGVVDGLATDLDLVETHNVKSGAMAEAFMLTYRYEVGVLESSSPLKLEGRQRIDSSSASPGLIGRCLRVKYLVDEPRKSVLEDFPLNETALEDSRVISDKGHA